MDSEERREPFCRSEYLKRLFGKDFPDFRPVFWIFDTENVYFGPWDASGWLQDAILLRIGGLGPRNEGAQGPGTKGPGPGTRARD